MARSLSGILVVNKHRGISSAGVLTRIKHLFPKPQRPKFGHAGTLDPFATGVLLVLVGKTTKRCNELMGQEKRYSATIKLGATTATLDPTSDEIPDPMFQLQASDLKSQIDRILPQFVGEILQAPPVFSAIRQGGKRAYQLARQGKDVELEPRLVRIYSLEIVSFEFPFLQIDVRCGKGTYIRSLARDLAIAAGTTGYLTQLIRTAVGEYTIEQSLDAETITADNLQSHLR